MSKQLKLSASVSLMAMLSFIVAANLVMADDLGLATAHIGALADVYASAIKGDLLSLL